jgi:Transglycosylase-like domain
MALALFPVGLQTPVSAAKQAKAPRIARGDARHVDGSRRHRKTVFDAFNVCVANREAGSPGSESASTVDWHIIDGDYEGGYQFIESTWLAAGGSRYASAANLANPEQQTVIFNYWEARDPGSWPKSVPACGG